MIYLREGVIGKVPVIPQMENQKVYPLSPMSPGVSGQIGETIERSGRQMERLGEYGSQIVGAIQKAKDTSLILQLETSLDADITKGALELRKTTDYQNMEQSGAEFINDLQKKYTELTKDNPRVADAFNRHLQKKSGDYSKAVTLRTLDLMHETDSYNALIKRDNLAQDIANSTSPEDIETKKATFAKEMETLAKTGNLKLGQVYNIVKGLDQKVKDHYETITDQQIMLNPADAVLKLLDDKTYLPGFTGEARQRKLEKAISADKIWRNEQDKKLKDQVKLVHDEEEQKIGDIFLKGNYKDAYLLVQSSKLLSGDEKKTWGNAIDAKTKEKAKKADPRIEIAEIVFTNNMMATGVDPNVIRKSIIMGDSGEVVKKQQLAKLETKVSQEIQDGRTHAYQDIVHIVFPPAKGLSMENLIQTPQQTMAIMKAQTGLDDWINSQIKAGKYPTKNEIRKQGWSLAISYTPSFKEKMEYNQKMIDSILK